MYILESKVNKEWYYGYTDNLKRRLEEHNQGHVFSTNRYKPWRLIYFEACLNKVDATRREKYLKTTQGNRMLRRRLKQYIWEQGKN